MRCLYDRQNKRLMIFAAVFGLSLTGILLFMAWQQGIRVRDSLFMWERRAASSLLEQGVPETAVAQAFANTDVTAQGEGLLVKMGHTEENIPLLFEEPGSAFLSAALTAALAGILLTVVLCAVLIGYMERRERMFETAAGIVGKYAEGDFSERITEKTEEKTAGVSAGTVRRFFQSVDRLSTALQAKSEAERKAKEFLKDTVSDISHQLKTPLAALNMYIEIISGEPDNRQTVLEFADKSAQSLERMERLIYLLLRVMRLDAGSVVFEKHPVRIKELSVSAAEDLVTRAEKEGKEILFDGSPDMELVCDADWTKEALVNLMKNGLDHTEKGGWVRVSWSMSVSMTRVCVEDNGSGIAPEEIHHIFKRFYRSKCSLDTQGIGLGLPLAKSIVEGQGGVLSVQSSPGEGTVFTIAFPLQTESGIAARQTKSGIAARRQNS